MHDPIAYIYEADHHCEACTIARFGSTEGTDSEGNEVGAVFPWDEWWNPGEECEVLACGDCYEPLDNAHADDCEQHGGDAPCTIREELRV